MQLAVELNMSATEINPCLKRLKRNVDYLGENIRMFKPRLLIKNVNHEQFLELLNNL